MIQFLIKYFSGLLPSECERNISLDDDENEENRALDNKISDDEDDRVSASNIESTLNDEESKPTDETLKEDVSSNSTLPVNALLSLGADYGSDTDDDDGKFFFKLGGYKIIVD